MLVLLLVNYQGMDVVCYVLEISVKSKTWLDPDGRRSDSYEEIRNRVIKTIQVLPL